MPRRCPEWAAADIPEWACNQWARSQDDLTQVRVSAQKASLSVRMGRLCFIRRLVLFFKGLSHLFEEVHVLAADGKGVGSVLQF